MVMPEIRRALPSFTDSAKLEKIAGMLQELGYAPCQEDADADIIVFNTCCIRDTAEKKIQGNIGVLKSLKRERKDMIIAVVGCMTGGSKEPPGYLLLHPKFTHTFW